MLDFVLGEPGVGTQTQLATIQLSNLNRMIKTQDFNVKGWKKLKIIIKNYEFFFVFKPKPNLLFCYGVTSYMYMVEFLEAINDDLW